MRFHKQAIPHKPHEEKLSTQGRVAVSDPGLMMGGGQLSVAASLLQGHPAQDQCSVFVCIKHQHCKCASSIIIKIALHV